MREVVLENKLIWSKEDYENNFHKNHKLFIGKFYLIIVII